MLTILIGTDWIANRDEILNRIAQNVEQELPGQILIVPELISHDTERRLCKAASDTCSRFAEVLTFSRLAKRVSDYDCRALRPCLDNGGRIVAIASAVKQLRSKLKTYASVETNPEFLTGLLDMVDEFKRCCITPVDLMEASKRTEGSFAQKLEELSLLLESYDSVCANGKCDPRDQMSWLLEELEDSAYGQEHCFYIDGFPDFTNQHLHILQHLIQVSKGVTVSFTCDEIGSEAMAFEKAGQTAAMLKQFAKEHGIPVAVERIVPRQNSLRPVQDLLLQGDIGSTQCSRITTLEAKNIRQECEAALETVMRRVQNGARYRDINIVCGDMSAYRNTLELLFTKCRIPLYISGTESILEQPAVAAVFYALDAALSGFEQRDVLQYLKSMISPITVETCDLMENYAVMWDIHGKKWLQEWKNHPYTLGGKITESAQRKLLKLNDARKMAIDPLVQLHDDMADAVNLGEQVKALYSFLESIQYNRKLRTYAQSLEDNGSGREAQILNQLWDILITALEQLYEMLGMTSWEPENFSRLLRLLITQYNVGTIPPVLDAVSVGPTDVMRCQQCAHLIVLGAEEGVLPGYAGSAGMLTDQERQALRKLGVPLTGGSMDGLLAEFADIYGVFTSADHSICVSYAGGQPSFVFKRLSVLSSQTDAKTPILGASMANSTDAAAYLLRKNTEDLAEKLHIETECQNLQKRAEHALGNIQTENIRKLYGTQLQLSASQIDRLAQCRLAYFLQYGLFAKERLVAEVNPAEFGTYVHAVLEEAVQEAMLNGGTETITADGFVAIARKHSDRYAQEHFSELDSERMTYLFRRNWEELELIARELWAELQDSLFKPVGFEVGFGDAADISAINVSGKQMSAHLRGFVDRIDLWEKDGKRYFRVVDYKTGKKDFDYCDIYNGYGLQMLLYLFAMEESHSEMVGEEPVPAGVQYFPARVPLVSADSLLTDEEAEEARKKLWKRKGLLLAQEDVLAAMESGDNPCRMPYTKKKDGSISGDIADKVQFHLLKKFVFSKVGKMVDEIASGAVEPNPYTRGGSHNACAYCPYSTVCHKLTVEGRRNYQAISDKQFWEDVAKEMSK